MRQGHFRPAGGGPEVTIWRIDLDAGAADAGKGEADALDAALRTLDALERARHASFAFERDRRRFAIGRAALRWILAAELGVAPTAVPLCAGAHGKPELTCNPALAFNLSHSGNLALIAVSSDTGALGIDIEQCRPIPEAQALAATHFSLREQATLAAVNHRADVFHAIWTRKEAVIKALGLGVGSLDLTTVHVGCAGAQQVELEGQSLVVDALDAGAGLIASLAVAGSSRAVIRLRLPMVSTAHAMESELQPVATYD